MSEARKQAYRWAVDEAFNKGNLGAMDKVLSADYVHHRPPHSDIEGADAYKQFVADVIQECQKFAAEQEDEAPESLRSAA